jgi:hypothetical protein
MKSTRTSILALTGIFLICSSTTQPASQSYQLTAPTHSADPYAHMSSKEIQEELLVFEKTCTSEKQEFNKNKHCCGLREKQAKFCATCCPITVTAAAGLISYTIGYTMAKSDPTFSDGIEKLPPVALHFCAGLVCAAAPVFALVASAPVLCVNAYFNCFPEELIESQTLRRRNIEQALTRKRQDEASERLQLNIKAAKRAALWQQYVKRKIDKLKTD